MAAKLSHYEVNVNGIRHEFQLTAEDAERMGATEVKTASAPANKAAKPADK